MSSWVQTRKIKTKQDIFENISPNKDALEEKWIESKNKCFMAHAKTIFELWLQGRLTAE